MKISYVITCHNEIDEMEILLPFLLKHKRKDDNIVILFDNNGDNNLWLKLLTYSEKNPTIRLQQNTFSGDFSIWKNLANSFADGEFIINLDADEMVNEDFIRWVPVLIEHNKDVDLIWVSRENYVEGLTPKHIELWGWNVDSQKRVNYPDLQSRIYKNSPEIRWEGKVHEKIVGYKKESNMLPSLYITHKKTIERQEKQNQYYNTL